MKRKKKKADLLLAYCKIYHPTLWPELGLSWEGAGLCRAWPGLRGVARKGGVSRLRGLVWKGKEPGDLILR